MLTNIVNKNIRRSKVDYLERIKEVTKDLFNIPELGFKEFKTSKKIQDELKFLNPNIEMEIFSKTGIKTYLSKDKDITICFLAELDAVYAPSHFNADPETGAAHNCGHFTQMSIALALYERLFNSEEYKNWDYNICFIFIPAEEYVDLPYRKKLAEDGEIVHLGGKAEAMRLGIFDDIDAVYCVHAIGEIFSKPTIELYCDLAGFMYKYYTFEGKTSHAGFDPFSGVNAYSMSTLFNVGVGLSRQQFIDTESVRLNPILIDGDMTTNVISNKVKIGTDLRCKTIPYMRDMSKKLDRIAEGSAYSLGGSVEIETDMGYLPFVQNKYLTSFAMDAYKEFPEDLDIIDDRGGIAAAGDIGDLSFMMPCAQISYGGFTGTIHGDDFKLDDENFVLSTFPKYLESMFKKLNGNIDRDNLYKKSYEEYKKLIDEI